MAKNKSESKRLDSIPLPDTVKDACMRVSRDVPCVSHTVQATPEDAGKSPSELSSGNHAFFLGKIIPQTTSEKVRKVLGWGSVKERIYSGEFIKGALDYLFSHLKNGEKARFVECRCLSEMFNGPEDVEYAMSRTEEADLIYRFAQETFKKGKDQIEVVSIEDDPRHQELFQALRSSMDLATQKVDIDKALGGESKALPENSNSLDIAKALYAAAKSSDAFTQALRHAVPQGLKSDEESTQQWYALTEIAFRLSEILNGRFIHGGVERQGVYDEVIAKIMKGKKGGYKNILKLTPLFSLFEGKRFETLHLDTDKNPYRLKKTRLLARVRIALLAAITSLFVAGGIEIGAQREQRKFEEIQRLFRSEIEKGLKGVYLPEYDQESEADVAKVKMDIFREVADRLMDVLARRYQIPEDTLRQLHLPLQAHLLRDPGKLRFLHYDTQWAGDRFHATDEVDGFVRENALFFASRGIDVEKPYSDLRPHIEKFRALLKSDENFSFHLDPPQHFLRGEGKPQDIEVKDPMNAGGPAGIKFLKFRHLGSFSSGEGYWGTDYHFYLSQEGRLMAAKVNPGIQESFETLSSKDAREGILEYFYAMRRFDLLPLVKFDELLRDLNPSALRECPADGLLSDDDAEALRPVEVRDSLTGDVYQVVRKIVYLELNNSLVPCLYVKGPGDQNFTRKAVKGLTEKYLEVMYNSTFSQTERFRLGAGVVDR